MYPYEFSLGINGSGDIGCMCDCNVELGVDKSDSKSFRKLYLSSCSSLHDPVHPALE